jgi:hypothetical protein
MSEFNISNQEATAELYVQTADAMCAYMDDCNFDETHLTGNLLWLALEYAYRPHPRFWRDFDITTIVDAVSRRFPNWRATLEKTGRSASAVLRQFEEAVQSNAFYEANAETLMALSDSERPTTSYAAFDWILAALAEKGLTTELELAECDGDDCGTELLLALHRLEHAQRGIVVDRIGRFVALQYRHAAMKRGEEYSALRSKCA